MPIAMPMGGPAPAPETDDVFGKVMKDPWFRLGMALLKEGGPQDRPHSVGQDIARAVETVQGQMDDDLVRDDQRRKMDFQRQMQGPALELMQAAMSSGGMPAGAPRMTAPQAPYTPPPVANRIDPVANPSSDIKLSFSVPQQYEPMLRRASQMYGVPYQLLAAQAQHESAGTWNPNVKGQMGEIGIPQFMPKTAREYGLIGEDGSDNRNNPELSFNAQAKFMRDLYNRTGNWFDATHRYNASPNNPMGKRYARTVLGLAGMTDAVPSSGMPTEGAAAAPGGAPPPAMPPSPTAPTPVPPDLNKMFMWQAYSSSGGDSAKFIGEYNRLVLGWQMEQAKANRSAHDAMSKAFYEDQLARMRQEDEQSFKRSEREATQTFQTEQARADAERKPQVAYDETRAKDDAERFGRLEASVLQTEDGLYSVAQMKSLLQQGIMTGGASEQLNEFKKLVKSTTGADIDTGGADFIGSLGGQFLKALRAQQAANGTKDPNPSNADLIFDQKIIPSMQNSPEGNMLILLQMQRTMRRNLELAEAAFVFKEREKRFDALKFRQSPEAQSVYQRYRLKSGEAERLQKAARALMQGAPEVEDEEQYNALPSGTVFVTPDYRIKRKP